MAKTLTTDRLLLMIVVATGFAVILGGWAASLVHAEATGLEQLGLRVAIGAVFFVAVLGTWYQFSKMDTETAS